MLSITDSFKPIDKCCADTLAKIEALINSESLLAGIGDYSDKFPVSKKYNIVTSFDRAVYLTESQDMCSEDDTSNDQYFPNILDAIIPRYGEPILDYESATSRRDALNVHFNQDFMDALTKHINSVLEKQNISEFMCKRYIDIEKDRVPAYVFNSIHNTTFTYIETFLVSAYFGGMKEWPVCEYIFECLKDGAFPCGWVGEFPENVAQAYHACRNSLQVLHFGPQEVL